MMAELGPELEAWRWRISRPSSRPKWPDFRRKWRRSASISRRAVSQECDAQMPAIMEEVRRALEEAGIDADNVDGWQDLDGFDAEEVAPGAAGSARRDEVSARAGTAGRNPRGDGRSARRDRFATATEIAAAHARKPCTAWPSLARRWPRLAPKSRRRAPVATSKAGLDGATFDFDRDVMREPA